MKWIDSEKWHVYPVNDVVAHNTNGFMCRCNPKVEKQDNGNYVIVHNSFDGREKKEQNIKSN